MRPVQCVAALHPTFDWTIICEGIIKRYNHYRAFLLSVLYHAMLLLVSWTHTDNSVFDSLVNHPKLKPWLQRLVLLAPEVGVAWGFK